MAIRPLLFSGLVALMTAMHALDTSSVQCWTSWFIGWLTSSMPHPQSAAHSCARTAQAPLQPALEPAVEGAKDSAVRREPLTQASPVDSDQAHEANAVAEGANLAVPELIALSRRTLVFAAPQPGAERLGYLRTGGRVARSSEPVGSDACRRGWYRVAPYGFACLDETATLDPTHPVAVLAERRPDRYAPLPYAYGATGGATPPLYARLPTRAEQQQVEKWLPSSGNALAKDWQDTTLFDVPDPVRDGRPLPTAFGFARGQQSLLIGHARGRSGFGFLGFHVSDGRVFGLSTDMSFVPVDRLRKIVPSSFSGLRLNEQTKLPVAFVMSRHAFLYSGNPRQGGLRMARALNHREALPLSEERVTLGTTRYLRSIEGGWLIDRDLVRVEPPQSLPSFATPDSKWLDISLSRQTLVAYEGTKAVFVTLVSTGSDGAEVADAKRATIQGVFRIHTKHVTATMSSDEVGDEYTLADVPYVQYFSEGYALHGVYWHDAFGHRKSHGCINLSPLDARWIFQFTDPAVPLAWHGAMSRLGTRVYIHP